MSVEQRHTEADADRAAAWLKDFTSVREFTALPFSADNLATMYFEVGTLDVADLIAAVRADTERAALDRAAKACEGQFGIDIAGVSTQREREIAVATARAACETLRREIIASIRALAAAPTTEDRT